MGSVTNHEKTHFLISISKGRLSPDASFEQATDFWYHKPAYHDLYAAASKIAFTTLARTVRGLSRNPHRDELKSKASDYLNHRLKHLHATTQADFDAWHRETSQNLIDIFTKYDQTFTVGQAQKWINMSLKHLAIADAAITAPYYNFCHVPIDSYIIKALQSDLVPEEMRQIDTSFGQNPDKIPAWSRIDDYDAYLQFQKDFRAKCGEPPLDYEFHLWQKQKEEYA